MVGIDPTLSQGIGIPEVVVERVAHFFAVFMTRSGCAGRTTFLLGSAVSTLSDWRQKYPELDECMAEAREKARLKMLQRIKRAAEDD